MAHSKSTMDALHRAVEALKEWDMSHNTPLTYSTMASAVIEALSTPEVVLPLAEEMLRAVGVYEVCLSNLGTSAMRDESGKCIATALLDAYRAAMAEP